MCHDQHKSIEFVVLSVIGSSISCVYLMYSLLSMFFFECHSNHREACLHMQAPSIKTCVVGIYQKVQLPMVYALVLFLVVIVFNVLKRSDINSM